MEQKQEQGIVSPYAPKRGKKIITPEEIEAVKKLLGVKCIFIVADTEEHNCTAATCTGHDYTIEGDGFSDEQLAGIFVGLAQRVIDIDLRHIDDIEEGDDDK